MSAEERAVIAPLVYSALFSFPLTLHEVARYCHGKISVGECQRILLSLAPEVQQKDGYFFLKGNEQFVSLRKNGTVYAERKYQAALRIVSLFRHIPSVKFIGLSGTVANGSAKKSDDVDLFIITQQNTLFTTRSIMLFMLQLLGKRRRRLDPVGQDTVCLNMFLDDTVLQFSSDRQDLYTAREITQMTPLYDRDNTQRDFWRQNNWLVSHLPNALPRKAVYEKQSGAGGFSVILLRLFYNPVIESLLRWYQMRRIIKHTTSETVRTGFLAFHTHDYHRKTLQRFTANMIRYEAKKTMKILSNDTVDKGQNIFYTAY